MMAKNIINVAEMAGEKWDFIERYYPPFYSDDKSDNNSINWSYFSGSSSNLLERIISRPKISRYRACFQATRHLVKKNDIAISHLPRTSHWQSIFMHLLRKKNRHLAFSFNFTDLPVGSMHRAMKESFRRIDGFVVYSNFEREKYAEYFGIPIEKLHMLHWAMETPKTDPSFNPIDKPYYCAVGGEGRDYQTLIKTFKLLPEQQLIIVTRPNTLGDIKIPSNVHVYYNLPSQKFWRIVEKSQGVIVPLVDKNTACGHISLVGAMLLKKAIITSFSHGTTDYIKDNINGIIVPHKDITELKNAIQRIDTDSELRKRIESYNLQFAQKYCHPSLWANFIQNFVQQQ
jgi:glycosyltransferase involved in cell wall biosynthesis